MYSKFFKQPQTIDAILKFVVAGILILISFTF